MWTAYHRGIIVGLNQATWPPDLRLTAEDTDPTRLSWTLQNYQEYVRLLNELDPKANNDLNALNPYTTGVCSYPNA